jgi:hypothetical protein
MRCQPRSNPQRRGRPSTVSPGCHSEAETILNTLGSVLAGEWTQEQGQGVSVAPESHNIWDRFKMFLLVYNSCTGVLSGHFHICVQCMLVWFILSILPLSLKMILTGLLRT